MQGKVALVTGSAKGIGRAIALGMAGAGYQVVVHYRTSRAEADEVVERIHAHGGEACALQADVTDQPQVEQLVNQAAARWGWLDVLVN
ncbi:MAG: SDR family NAD(P)-dependent oxidoreductase, partial [Deinococcus sp.]|nr:SDR family NAD(P)-dependent oxidoreductase [Deinococcus sp.]